MALEIIKRCENAELKHIYGRICTDRNYGTYQVETPVLYYVVEGKITLIYKKEKIVYNSGEAFFLPRGMKVAFEKEADPDNGKFTSLYIFMCIDLLSIDDHACFLQKPKIHTILRKSYKLKAPFTCALVYLTRCCLELNEVNLDRLVTLTFIKFVCLGDDNLYLHILLFCSQSGVNYEQLVLNNITHNVSEVAHFSYGSYQKLYYRRRKSGLPPLGKIRRNYLMLFAQKHVLTSTIKIKFLATMFGYANPSHFTRAYTEKFGISPLKHRKQLM